MRARTELRTLVCVLTVLLFPRPEVSADACEDALEADAAVFASACTEAALRDPYRFAWLLLARICDLEAAEPKACEWQGWATFADTFPAAPIPDRSKPQWPGAGRRYPPVSVTDCTVGGEARPRHYKSMDSDRPADPCEEIYDFRFNQEAFDYIVGKGLWYREGVASFWQEEEPVDFPESAVALQAGWKRIDESQKKDYHWVVSRDDEGEPLLCGLTGLDVKSKLLPRWIWIALEHVDNPGRCDVIGCRDDFGQSPRFTPPHRRLGATYAPEAPTEDLVRLLPSSQNGPWKNYRLKGVLADFVESDGRPTVLANSVRQIEGDFFPAAPSCITCHSRARFGDHGKADLDWSGGVATAFPVVRGAPDPSWIYSTNAGSDLPWQQQYKQSNFIWSIPLYACPKLPSPGE